MATYTDVTLQLNLTDDATFRSWGQKIAAAIAAVGLVQTADTGQINWATVLKPVSNSTAAGYEIYRFNDTLQATAPVFVKVEYGMGAGAGIVALWVTVGTATNGAGALSGNYVSSRRTVAANSTSGSSGSLWCSGSGSRLGLYTALAGSLNFSLLIVIERTKDNAGVDTNDGVWFWASTQANNFTQQVIPFPKNGAVEAPPAASAIPNFVYPASGMVSTFGGDVGLGMGIAFIGKPYYLLGLLMAANGDIGAGGTFVVTILGSNHTYISFAGTSNSSGINGKDAAHAVALRWE